MKNSRKRVRFADDALVRALKHKMDVTSWTQKACHFPNEPKISEYKSFNKVIQEAADKLQVDQQHRHVKLMTLEVGKEVEAPNRSDVTKHIFPEKVPPIYHDNFDLHAQCRICPGVNNSPGGLFHEKRCMVLKVAAESLSIEFNELVSKSHDFISTFLLRLGIDSKICDNDEQFKSARNGEEMMEQFSDASISEICPKESGEDQRKDETVIATMRNTENMLEPWCDEIHDISSWQRTAEHPFTIRSESSDLNRNKKVVFFTDGERKSSSGGMKTGPWRDRKDFAFWLLPAPDNIYESREQLIDIGRRNLLTEVELNSDINPREDFLISNFLRADILDFDFAKKTQVTPWGVSLLEDYSERSHHFCEWPRLLGTDKFHSPEEILERRDQSEIKLLGWEERAMDRDSPSLPDFALEKERLQQPLTPYRVRNSSSMVCGNSPMEFLDLESRQTHFPQVVSHIETFKDEEYPSLDDFRDPGSDFITRWKRSPIGYSKNPDLFCENWMKKKYGCRTHVDTFL